ncbi:MAG: SDR family NAD(P)-dependent oxidoreductase [bacterium]|nr:SDR family NAD(P)-dependent oxidoreductase [bacterium]
MGAGMFEGRNAFVTGAANGIGRGVALRLASAGAVLALNDIDAAALEAVVGEIRDGGGHAVAFPADVSSPAAVRAAVGEAIDALGPLTLGVTSAGIVEIVPALELTEQAWDRMLGINLKGTFFTLQALARHMMAGDGGRLVAIASIGAKRGRADAVDYTASKAAVVSVVQSLAMALAPKVQVNAVCPGIVDTAMTPKIHEARAARAGITPQESIDALVATIPMGRIQTPDDVARSVQHFLSEEADYVTGQALNVDGGLIFH